MITVKKKVSIITILATALATVPAANAFRSVDFESYTDPDYKGYKPKKIVLLVANSSNEVRQTVEKNLKADMGKYEVTVVSYRELFPPTRQWSSKEQEDALKNASIDSGLIITVGASSSSVIHLATQSYGSYSVFGSYGSNGTFGVSGTGTRSYNVYGVKSRAESSAVLLHLEKNRTVWYADILTKAGGLLFVGEKRDARGFVKGVVSGLLKDGHLEKEIK